MYVNVFVFRAIAAAAACNSILKRVWQKYDTQVNILITFSTNQIRDRLYMIHKFKLANIVVFCYFITVYNFKRFQLPIKPFHSDPVVVCEYHLKCCFRLVSRKFHTTSIDLGIWNWCILNFEPIFFPASLMFICDIKCIGVCICSYTIELKRGNNDVKDFLLKNRKCRINIETHLIDSGFNWNNLILLCCYSSATTTTTATPNRIDTFNESERWQCVFFMPIWMQQKSNKTITNWLNAKINMMVWLV